jgi:hypothetical protein
VRTWGIAAGLIVAAVGTVAWLAWPTDEPGGFRGERAALRGDGGPGEQPGLGELADDAPRRRPRHDAAVLPARGPEARSRPEPPREVGVRYLRVVDEDGHPAPDARILVIRRGIIDAYDWEDFSTGGEPVDAWGRYTIEIEIDDDADTHWLAMGRNGRCSEIVQTPEGTGDFILTLHDGNVVSGTVRDATSGNPLRGVTVVLAMGNTGASVWQPEMVTGADGRYRFAGLPPGKACIPILRDAERFGGRDVCDAYELWGWDAVEEEHDGLEESLDSMFARGRAKVFARTGETAEVELRASVTPGQDLTLQLQLPEGVPADAVIACRWRRPDGTDPAVELRRFACKRGSASWELFLRAGSHTFEFVANGARAEAVLHAAAGRDALPARSVALMPTRPLVIQFVGERGEPRREAGIALHHGVAFELGEPAIGGRREVETQSAATSDAKGLARYPEPPVFWPGKHGTPQALYLAAGGESLFTLPHRRLGLSHVRFPIASFEGGLREAGREPIVLRVPARSWAPLPLRVVDGEGRPLGGVKLESTRAQAFESSTDWVTRSDGRAELRLLATLDLAPSEAGNRSIVRIATPELFGQVETHQLLSDLRPAPYAHRGGRFYVSGVHTLVAAPGRTVSVSCVNHAGALLPEVDGVFTARSRGVRIDTRTRTDPSGRIRVKLPRSGEPIQLSFARDDGAMGLATLDADATTATIQTSPRARRR